MLLDTYAKLLQSECHLRTDNLLLVGISGGPDSICLLHMLHRLSYPTVAVHVNHKLRPEADQEAEVVEHFVKGLGIDFLCSIVDVHSYAAEHSLSIEEAARTLRYQVLFNQAKRSGAVAVLVAHNADDQIETILMHLLRGSGLTGLRGMQHRTLPNPWSRKIALIRPLLFTWRDEILQYLSEQGLSYCSDQSNYDTTYLRNRLRYELLPILEKYNPRLRQNLLQMSRINQADYEIIQQLVAAAWEANFVRQGPGYVAFRLSGFRQLSLPIQRYLLRQAIAYHLPSLRDIDFESIERGISFLCADRSLGQSDLIAGLRLLKEGDVFWLATWQADLPGTDYPSIQAGADLALAIPGQVWLSDGWVLNAVEEPDTGMAIHQSSGNDDLFQTWLDLDQLEFPLSVRSRKGGERFQPLGMDGHSLKVSDLMINLKLPKRARPTWPMICSGQLILWIPGCRQSNVGKIQPDSLRIVHLTLCRSSST